MNLFETLLHPDREELENSERHAVGQAANLLQIGEFQILQLAYHEWFGQDLPNYLVDRVFRAYMVEDHVPYWARHYAQQVIRLDNDNRLDSNRAHYHRYDHEYHKNRVGSVRRFSLVAGCLLLFMAILIFAAEYSTTRGTSIFPPYLDVEDIRPAQP